MSPDTEIITMKWSTMIPLQKWTNNMNAYAAYNVLLNHSKTEIV